MHNWQILGRIFIPENDNPYLISHASNPCAILLYDDVFRVFYNGRNTNNKASISYVDIDIVRQKVITYPKDPLLTYGGHNTFYANGLSIGNIYEAQGERYMLFMAWQLPEKAHWHGVLGRINILSNGSLKVAPKEVFLGLDQEDSISLSYPFVLYHDGVFRMWYGSTLTWDAGNGEMLHVIKYATSKDGLKWQKHGIAIPYEIGVAQTFSKPSVIIDSNGFHMWYAYRGDKASTYRIGYAHSVDGVNWDNRLNGVGLVVSENGWDSEMICYPFVFNHKCRRYMLYNGNGYGKTGIGLAFENDVL